MCDRTPSSLHSKVPTAAEPAWLCPKANKLAVSAHLAQRYLQMLLATSQKSCRNPNPATAQRHSCMPLQQCVLSIGCADTTSMIPLPRTAMLIPQHRVFVLCCGCLHTSSPNGSRVCRSIAGCADIAAANPARCLLAANHRTPYPHAIATATAWQPAVRANSRAALFTVYKCLLRLSSCCATSATGYAADNCSRRRRNRTVQRTQSDTAASSSGTQQHGMAAATVYAAHLSPSSHDMYLVSPIRALLIRPGSLVTAMPLTRSLSPAVAFCAIVMLIWHLGAAEGWMPSMKVTSWL